MNVTLEQQIAKKQKELADLRRKQQKETEKRRARLGAIVERICTDLPTDESTWEGYVQKLYSKAVKQVQQENAAANK